MRNKYICCLALILVLGFAGKAALADSGKLGTSGALPAMRVDCNSETTIYTNATKDVVFVTVQAQDECGFTRKEGSLSCLKVSGDKTVYELPPGGARAATFAVPENDGSVILSCKGEMGEGCDYTLLIH